jgi:hypothetical protein
LGIKRIENGWKSLWIVSIFSSPCFSSWKQRGRCSKMSLGLRSVDGSNSS